MHHRLAVLGLTAGLLGGSAAGLAFTVPGVASAQTDQTTTTAPATTGTAARPSPADHIREALAPLVSDGTITQAQAEGVVAALEQARPPRGFRGGRDGHVLRVAADAIGITVDDLRSALMGGQTIAQVAESKGVAAPTVIDAMVADAKAHLDEHVADGDLTQAEADARLADITERISDMVTSTRPRVDPGPRGHAG